MRRSLVRSTVLLVLFAVVGLAVPISFVFRNVIRQEAINRLQQQAGDVAVGFSDELLAGAPINKAELDKVIPGKDRITLRLANGTELTAGPQRSFPSELRVTVEGPAGSTLTVAISGEAVRHRTRVTELLILLTGLGVLLISALLSWWQAGRLTCPLELVAARTELLGTGELAAEVPLSGMPEVDAVAGALNRLSDRVRELVRSEREFSSNASHQLRSGLTSLRLRLETLKQTPHDDVRDDVSAALAQAEKLSDTVEGLLRLARTGRAGDASRYDLERVVRHRIARIEPLVLSAKRAVHVTSIGNTEVTGSPTAVGEAVDLLLSNAYRHGRGTIGVAIAEEGEHRSVTVTDEGPGIAEEALSTLFQRHPDPDGHGIGLSLARGLLEGEGGQLLLTRARPATFRLVVPRGRASS